MVKSLKKSKKHGSKLSNTSNKRRVLGSEAKAAGYAKRHARKPASTSAPLDVYEYAPEKTRRSKVKLDLDREEAAEFGGDFGDDPDERETLRARLIGEGGEDEQIDSGDDEEIDSDEAFEESDEERFAGFFSYKKPVNAKKKTKTKGKEVRFADVNLDEGEDQEGGDESQGGEQSDEEEEEEGDDDEFIDILDVLDGKGDVDLDSDEDNRIEITPPQLTGSSRVARPSEDESDEQDSEDESLADSDKSELEDEDEGEDGATAMALSLSDDEEEYAPEALDQLQSFISTLDTRSQKRKQPSDGDVLPESNADSRARKRRAIKELNEAGAEGEFRALSSGSKLKLDDLLAPLGGQSSALLSLKQSVKALHPSSSKNKTLDAPLPQRAQERLDREAAYGQTKEEVNKWSATMKRIREAEHLSFPLQAQPEVGVSNLQLTSKFKPTTALESSVDALLKSAKLREQDIEQTEAGMLEANQITVEEVAQRRGELRKMRELMFRAEIKARRIGKIKSKTYRKIKRKEKERLGEKLAEAEVDIDDEESRMKKEVDRARERATLKHKHTGKWARQMRGKEGLSQDARKDIEEMLDRGEKLRRRIQGLGDGDEGGDNESDEDSVGEGDVEKIKQDAFDELQAIEAQYGNALTDKTSGIFQMKFMKDAMARQEREANKIADDFLKEMGAGNVNSDGESEGEASNAPEQGALVQKTGGRMTFRPSDARLQLPSSRPLASLESDTSSVTLKSTDLVSPPPQSPTQPFKQGPFSQSELENPWLVPPTTTKAPRKKNEIVVGKDSHAQEKSKNKLKKLARKRDEDRAEAKDDAVVEVSMDTVLSVKPTTPADTTPTTPKSPAKKLAKDDSTAVSSSRVDNDDSDSDADSEVDIQEATMNQKGKRKGNAQGLKAFEQRDLVALAFAGDNVAKDFEEAKRRAVAEDAPREIDTTLPGWGSWGGAGTSTKPSKTKKYVKRIPGILPSARKDYSSPLVIISEKVDKKAAKYLVKDLPYPYTSRAQFERSLERPVGAQWNTRLAFQRDTMPRVAVKPGTIIEPLEKLN